MKSNVAKSNNLLKCTSNRIFHTFRSILVEFGTEILHVMPLRNFTLHKNRYSDSYTALMELIILFRVFYIF